MANLLLIRLEEVVGASALSAVIAGGRARELPHLNGESEVALEKSTIADRDAEESILQLAKAEDRARTGVGEAAVVRANRRLSVAAVQAATALAAITRAGIISSAERLTIGSHTTLRLAGLKLDIAALGSSIDLDEAGAVEELARDTVRLSDPAVAAGAVVGVGSQSAENKLEVRVKADTGALSDKDAVEEGTLLDEERLAGLCVDQRGRDALALRVGQVAGQTEAVGLEDRAAAATSQLADRNRVNVREGSITANKAQGIGDLRSHVRGLDNVVEGHLCR